ncbi:hypothetical protein P2318_24230 [Myxococcaceae bacterium GXIMD 01537]
MAELPLLVAGPILRRVEPGLISVWVATSRSCKVRVDLFRGVADGATTGLVKDTPVLQGTEHDTIKAGANLHVCVATVKIADRGEGVPVGQRLEPDQLYSYNVVLKLGEAKHDLRSLGLLQDAGGDKPHLALGFNQGRLPSFALAPAALEDLVLIHGSCRRPAADGPDALAYVDDAIARTATEPRKRPHLLVMTGDQIYADDVSPFLLQEVHNAGSKLVDGPEPEQLPILDGPAPDPMQDLHWKDASLDNFPIGKRTLYCDSHARFTSQDRAQHLLSFGEFAGMYVLCFSNALWSKRPDPKALTKSDPLFQQLLQRVDGTKTPWLFDAEQDATDKKEAAEKAEREKKLSPAELADLRKKEQREENELDAREFISCRANLKRLQEFYDALPRVRRALANVPCLMMFDDHEITDDWNIVQRFKLEVYARPAGRAIVRNGLIAYALFQAWGNNPLEWGDAAVKGEDAAQREERNRRAQLLRVIDRATVGPMGWGTATAELDGLLDLRPTAAPTDPAKAPVRWHYRYRALHFELIALDSRTRRYFPGPISPAGLIDTPGLKAQIPEDPVDSSVEAVLVLAACPVIGPSTMDELVQPTALHVMAVMGHFEEQKAKGHDARLRARAKFLDKDPEPWGFEPGTFEALLARLEAHAAGRPVIFLSGDVHYSTSAVIDYFKGDRATRFIQLTSSAWKNEPGLITLVDPPFTQRALTEAIKPARVGWEKERPVPYALPADKRVPSSQIRNLSRSPLLLAADGWPEGTRVTRKPDWSWRYVPVLDERPEANDPGAPPPTLERRPAIAAGIPPPVEVPENPTPADLQNLAERHALQVDRLAPRRVVFSTNMCLVRFAPGPQGPSVRHELYYRPRAADPAQGQQAHTVFVIPLKTPASATPPTLGAP